MTIEYPRDICKNEVKQEDRSVQCDLCNKWNRIGCVGINSAHYEKLQNDTKPWYCPNCSNELPFSDMRDKDLNKIHIQSTPQTYFTNVPNKKKKGLMNKFQELNSLFDQSENTISCDFYDFSLLHLNISLLSCHMNDLVNFLALLNTKLDVICIPETRVSHKNLILSCQVITYERRYADLQICYPKELLSVSIDLMIPHNRSYILGTIYKHPSFKHFKFNNKYMEELLTVITHKNKNCVLTGDFSINLLKHARSADVSKFLANLLSHISCPK